MVLFATSLDNSLWESIPVSFATNENDHDSNNLQLAAVSIVQSSCGGHREAFVIKPVKLTRCVIVVR